MSKNPVFGVFPGDVCDSGPSSGCFNTWKSALNGNNTNNLFDRMFVSRGNHDSAGATFWASAFDFAGTAARIGATNFTGDDFTYSFDYGNSHVIALDAPGGDSSSISASQVSWIDADLTKAEQRGITNSFAFWHGPIKPEGGHCCTLDPRFVSVFGKHPSFKVSFHGHEHNIGETMFDSRYGNSGKPFLQVITGGAGAGLYACQSGQADFCSSSYGYAIADVNGGQVTISLYKKDAATPMKTVTVGVVGATPSPTASTSATPTPSNSATPTPTQSGATLNDATTGAGLNQFNYSGSWSTSTGMAGPYMNDNHWTNTAGAYYSVQFSGTQAKIYSEKNSGLGIVGISIDGGTETMVDAYATSRLDQQLLYTTPTLSNATHTIKVRITGTKNPASTGTYAVADRIDVMSGSAAVGDIDNNGKVDVFDLSAILSKWGSSDAGSDLNHDGTVNVMDLSMLLSNWTR